MSLLITCPVAGRPGPVPEPDGAAGGPHPNQGRRLTDVRDNRDGSTRLIGGTTARLYAARITDGTHAGGRA